MPGTAPGTRSSLHLLAHADGERIGRLDRVGGLDDLPSHEVVDRPWLGAYLMRDTGAQPNGLPLYESLGREVMRLNLTPCQSLHAVSAVMGFVIGTAGDLGQQPPQEVLDGTISRDDYIERQADPWRALYPADFPFLRSITDAFAQRDDTEQFRAGPDLLLAGVRQQADSRSDQAPSSAVERVYRNGCLGFVRVVIRCKLQVATVLVVGCVTIRDVVGGGDHRGCSAAQQSGNAVGPDRRGRLRRPRLSRGEGTRGPFRGARRGFWSRRSVWPWPWPSTASNETCDGLSSLV